MTEKVLFFINPISGTRKKNRLPVLIAQTAAHFGCEAELIHTRADGDYTYLAEKIHAEKISRIGICGGDGTVNMVVQSLRNLPVAFGIIPMGSGNGLALSAGIPRNTLKALRIFFEGSPRKVDAFTVNGGFACMLCGVGLDALVAHEFSRQRKRGLITYARLTTKAFFRYKAFPFRVQANDFSFDTTAYFISVANSNQFGNNVRIAPQASLSDGLLDVVIVKKMARPRLILALINQVFGGKVQSIPNSLDAPVIYFQAPALTILNPQEAPLHIDGEPRNAATTLDVQILPQAFTLIHGS